MNLNHLKIGYVLQRPNGLQWVTVKVCATDGQLQNCVVVSGSADRLTMVAMTKRGLRERDFVHTIWSRQITLTPTQTLAAELLTDVLLQSGKDFVMGTAK